MRDKTLQERGAALIERLQEAKNVAFPSYDMGLLWNPDDCAEAIEVLTLGAREIDNLKPESDMFRRAVLAAAVFQCGGPLAYLLRPGQSTVIDGPPAAAKRIAELTGALEAVITNFTVASRPDQDRLDAARAVLAKGAKP
jgi:hypothetical protein